MTLAEPAADDVLLAVDGVVIVNVLVVVVGTLPVPDAAAAVTFKTTDVGMSVCDVIVD